MEKIRVSGKILRQKISLKNRVRKLMEKNTGMGDKILGQKIDTKNSSHLAWSTKKILSYQIGGKNEVYKKNSRSECWHEKFSQKISGKNSNSESGKFKK